MIGGRLHDFLTWVLPVTLAHSSSICTIPPHRCALQGWISHFSPANVKVVLYEELMKDSRRVLTEVCEFLGIAIPADNALWAAMAAAETHSSPRTSTKAMLPEARARLDKFYAPYNQRLAHLLRLPAVPWG